MNSDDVCTLPSQLCDHAHTSSLFMGYCACVCMNGTMHMGYCACVCMNGTVFDCPHCMHWLPVTVPLAWSAGPHYIFSVQKRIRHFCDAASAQENR